ncbi:MAG: hypothetical protein CMH53_06070 [Myxococcales bacterium]|nr:hypothetical protein [Myxococcales bacterium]
MNTLRLTWLLLRKDMQVTARSKELVGVTLMFAVLCVLVFSFGFLQSGAAAIRYVPGVLWVTLLFTSSVSLLRLFAPEEEGGTLALVSMTTSGSAPLFWSKVCLQLLFSALVCALIVPLVLLFFDARLSNVGTVVAALGLGLIGQAVVGTLCAALLAQVRLKEVMLPLILYPMLAPLLIAGVKVTALSVTGVESPALSNWLSLMMVFDLIFMVVSPWLYGRATQP